MMREAKLPRHTTFGFTLDPTPTEVEALRRHVGAARFAFNTCLRFVQDALAERDLGPSPPPPWSGFDLINAFNAWKLTAAAGVAEDGTVGLAWRGEVCQQVFEEAAVDLGRALAAFTAGRAGERSGRPPRFPRFKRKATARPSFRLRNKGTGDRSAIRIGVGATARTIRLPKLGELRVRECTRRLRRMLRNERARVLFATVSLRSDGRWRVTLNLEAAELHAALRHAAQDPAAAAAAVGVDRGLATFAVLATADGREIERIDSPRPLRTALPELRRKSKAVSRKKPGSRNRYRARVKLGKVHARIASVRHDFVHRCSTRLAKTHGHLVIEDLCTAGVMRTRLARSVADSAWALFATLLAYKTKWYAATLTVADRFYPSTRRCSACAVVGDRLDLSTRTFHCSRCGHEADRDTNAAANLASYPSSGWPHVAAKHAETPNAWGEGSSGAQLLAVRETTLVEPGRAPARRPWRAVLAKTVNTL